MADFAPRRVYQAHHFDIQHDCHGHWIAQDRDGLSGGTFLSRRDAIRFALFETGGDATYVHEGKIAPHRGRR